MCKILTIMSLISQSVTTLTYILYLVPWSYDHPTYQRHSYITVSLFYTVTLSVITYVLPSLLYILTYRRRLPVRPDTWGSDHVFNGLRLVELLSVLVAFVTIGSTRRGPELFYEAQELTIGYGWSMEAARPDNKPVKKIPGRFSKLVAARTRRGKKHQQLDSEPPADSDREVDEDANGDIQEDAPLLGSSATSATAYSPASPLSIDEADNAIERPPNVLDYYQCSIFGLLFIGYIWPIASLAARRPELRPEDLPHLPEALRSENVELPGSRERFVLTPEELKEKEWNDKQGSSELGSGLAQKWTPWTLLVEVCRGQGWLIISCKWGHFRSFKRHVSDLVLLIICSAIVFEWISNAATFIPQYCMHEITQSFEKPNRQADMTYAYLMAFGLFFGTFMSSEYSLKNATALAI
jgi:hypothetical protein